MLSSKRSKSPSQLKHSDPDYDPRKRREYYLRTRELKGRPPVSTSVSAVRPVGTQTSTASKPSGKAPTAQVAKSKAAPVSAQVTQYRKDQETWDRLANVMGQIKKAEALLNQLVEQAKKRSGIETKSEAKAKTDTTTTSSSSTKRSSSEKRADAKRSKEYYEKNKDSSQSTPKSEAEKAEREALDKLQSIRDRIKKVREESSKPKTTAKSASKSTTKSAPPKTTGTSSASVGGAGGGVDWDKVRAKNAKQLAKK